MRICSLLPSATEIVFALGLGDQLVAVTHECDYPADTTHLHSVTRSSIDHAGSSSREIDNHVSYSIHSGSSIYYLDQELLRTLEPDVIFTQELCKVCAVSYGEVEQAVRFLQGETKVLSLEPTDLSGILESIEQVGQLTGVSDRAVEVVQRLRQRIELVVSTAHVTQDRPRVFAMEWLDPPFVGGHWVPEMVRLAGGIDGLGREGHPSFVASWDTIVDYDPEVAILMPCGFDLQRTIGELAQTIFPDQWYRLTAVRSGQVYAVDGSAYFSRPGPRIVDGLEILAEILHPELFPRTKALHCWQRLKKS